MVRFTGAFFASFLGAIATLSADAGREMSTAGTVGTIGCSAGFMMGAGMAGSGRAYWSHSLAPAAAAISTERPAAMSLRRTAGQRCGSGASVGAVIAAASDFT